MANELLHSVVNRGNGFATSLFPLQTSFVPSIDPVAASLRTFFGFDRVDTDYFVVAALRIISSYPDLLCRFQERQRNYTLKWQRPSVPQIWPAELVARDARSPFVRRLPLEWPPVFDTTLTLQDSNYAEIQQGDHTRQVQCRLGGEILRVEWPADAGIFGDLRMDDWTGVTSVSIRADPYGFPYREVASALTTSDDALTLLERQDGWEAFVNAPSDFRKVALVLTALGLDNKSVFPSDDGQQC